MIHMRATDELRETLACYVFGLLEEAEARSISDHLESCSVCRTEVRGFEAAAAELPHALQQTRPHPRVKERLMRRIGREKESPVEEFKPGIYFIREERGEWKATPWAGVSTKLLYYDRETNYLTSLLKLEPGAKYPAHHHKGVEQCLVLEGSVRIGDLAIRKGDFEWAAADTAHGIVTTDDGCTLLIIANRHDEIFA